jgi:hypothetical protein
VTGCRNSCDEEVNADANSIGKPYDQTLILCLRRISSSRRPGPNKEGFGLSRPSSTYRLDTDGKLGSFDVEWTREDFVVLGQVRGLGATTSFSTPRTNETERNIEQRHYRTECRFNCIGISFMSSTLLRCRALLRLVAGLTRLLRLVATLLPTANAAEAKTASHAEGSAAGRGGGGCIGCIVISGACGGWSS